MKPGPELDRLIAEKVMGWGNVRDYWPADTGLLLCDYGDGVAMVKPEAVKANSVGYRDIVFVPAYSTDISSAWEVVEHLVESGGPLADGHRHDLCVQASLNNGPEPACASIHDTSPMGYSGPKGEHIAAMEYICVYGESVPHSICLAALQAFGVSEGSPPTP